MKLEEEDITLGNVDMKPKSDSFLAGRLEFDIGENAADFEKEVIYLKQDLADMSAALKVSQC